MHGAEMKLADAARPLYLCLVKVLVTLQRPNMSIACGSRSISSVCEMPPLPVLHSFLHHGRTPQRACIHSFALDSPHQLYTLLTFR